MMRPLALGVFTLALIASAAVAKDAKPKPAPDLSRFLQKVQATWVIDCAILPTDVRPVSIRFVVSDDGYLSPEPIVVSDGGSPDAAQGAVDALHRGAPYGLDQVPRAFRNQPITANFHTEYVCGRK